VLILSGHDHDQCEVTHTYKWEGGEVEAHEITVGTISVLNGNKSPSYLMLTVGENYYGKMTELIQHKLCFLPDIRAIVKIYARAGVCSVLILLGIPFGELINIVGNGGGRRNIALGFRCELFTIDERVKVTFYAWTNVWLRHFRTFVRGLIYLIILLIIVGVGFITLLAPDSMILRLPMKSTQQT
jgi:hypothetical protein